jgi:AcrR family transcriptional regulator
MYERVSVRVRNCQGGSFLPVKQEGGRKRARKDAASLNSAILIAATSLVEEKGIAGSSMRAIAARAGMPTMTLYGYFPSKTAIVRALWAIAFDPLFSEMREVELLEEKPKARLRAVARTYVDYWLRFPDRYRMVFLLEDSPDSAEDSMFINQSDVVPSYLRFSPLIADALETNLDCRIEAEALICSLTGIAHMAITVSEYRWAHSSSYVDIIVDGVLNIGK